MKEITPKELKKLRDEKADFVLIDVREEYEFDDVNINGKLIPMGEVNERMDEIPRDKKVVVHCKAGSRSAAAIKTLEAQGYNNLYNLKGGIMAYIDEVGI
jgi:rhodanese-related sulfurtransferase